MSYAIKFAKDLQNGDIIISNSERLTVAGSQTVYNHPHPMFDFPVRINCDRGVVIASYESVPFPVEI